MKKLILLSLSLLTMLSSIQAATTHARKICIDHQWKFCIADSINASSPNYDDSQWRILDLPHDWSVEPEAAQRLGDNVGPFSKKSIGKTATGFTVGGTAWYRKVFKLEKKDKNHLISLYFEGAYNHAEVWINGIKCHQNNYGYMPFTIDITPYCRPAGQQNTIAVRVSNEGVNSRWYAGSGIYRHVWMVKTPKTFISTWDSFVRTTALNNRTATINVSTTVANQQTATENVTTVAEIFTPQGSKVASASKKIALGTDAKQVLHYDFNLPNAMLWSPENPQRYTLKLTAQTENGTTDIVTIPFGIRTLTFSADKGLLVNGTPTLLRGGCVHHDNGLLGAAAYNRAEDRKLQLLKNQGYNAVRCSHNIPSDHFLDACDSIGMMVIDECFDQWLVAKNPEDYHQFFNDNSTADIQKMIKRDRNHPSIIMWSIGNEIPGRIEPEGIAAAARLRNAIYSLDSTRPVTAAICDWDNYKHSWQEQSDNAFRSLDVGGYNYMYHRYESDHAQHPERIMFGSESFPKRAFENWQMVEKLPYVIGDFVWTAIDYLGEAGIGSSSIRTEGNQTFFQDYPWFNGWCGDIDLIGIKKPQSYYRDVVWRRAPITMAVEPHIPHGSYQSVSLWGWQMEDQSWTFPYSQQDSVTVNVYSRAPYVRLYLNNTLIGEKATSPTLWAGFKVGYMPGELRATTFDGKNEGESFILQTTSQPAAIQLLADRTTINANGQDLTYVTIALTDDKGRVINDSQRIVEISVKGKGTLAAAGNASPNDMQSFRSNHPRLYKGRAQAIIKSSNKPGKIYLTVSSANLPTQTICIHTQR